MTFEEYLKRKKTGSQKKEEEEKKKSSSSASASKPVNATNAKSGASKKNAAENDTEKTKSSSPLIERKNDFANSKSVFHSKPFYDAVQAKKKEQEIKKVSPYASGQIDSTVAENIGINTGEIDNITNKMSRKQINQTFSPTQSSEKTEEKAKTDYSERPVTTLKINGGRASGATTYISANGVDTDESYKFSSDKDYAEYTDNQKRIKELNQKINLINNSRGYYIPGETKETLTDELTRLVNRNKELIHPYETRIANENTDSLDKLPLSDIAGAYTRFEAGYKSNDGTQLTDGDEYKEWQKYYFYRLANDAGTNQDFQKYYAENSTTDYPKLNYVGNVTGSQLDAKTKALKLNSYYEYMTPEERHYFNYLGTVEGGASLQNDYAEMLLGSLMTRKANETPASNPFLQVGESFLSGVGKSIDDAAKGVQSTFGIGNYWADEMPQYGTVKNQVDTSKAGTLQKIANMAANSAGYMTPSLITSYLTGGASAAASIPTIGTKALKVASMVPMYFSSSGNAYTEGLSKGITDEQARVRGAMRGVSEVGTQYFLGGIKNFGGGKLGAALAKTGAGTKAIDAVSNVLSKLKNPYVKAALVNSGKIAANASGEMFEEYLQDYVIAPTIEGMTGGEFNYDLWDENSLYTLATAAISAISLNAPSDISSMTADFQRAGEISRANKTESYGTDTFSKTINQNTPNTDTDLNVSENGTENNNLPLENTNTLTEQNRGGLEGDFSWYSPETQEVLSKLTPAGRELLLTGKMSAAQINSLANEINDPTSENNSKSARRERIKNALEEVNGKKYTNAETSMEYLNDTEFDDYMKTGNQHTRHRKSALVEKGVDIILKDKESTDAFIVDALSGKLDSQIRAFSKADEKMVNDVYNETDGAIDISGYYLELNSDDIYHIKDHVNEDVPGAKILNVEDVKNLPQNMINYDDLISVRRQRDGRVVMTVGKKINGYSMMISIVSNGRKSLVLKSAYNIDTAKYKAIIGQKKKSAKSQGTTESHNSETMPIRPKNAPTSTLFNNSISQPDPTVNPENSQNPTEQPPTQTQPEVVGSGGEGTPPPTNNSENNQRILVTSKDVKGENNTPFKERMREAVRKLKTRFTATSEAFERADKKNGSDLTNRFYDALTSKAVADYNITDKQTDKNGNAIGKGLNEIFSRFYKKVKTNRSGDFKSMGKELIDPDYFAQVQNYVYAKHNLERATEGKGFLSDKLSWTAEQIAEFEAAHPDAVEFQQELVGYYRNMLLNSVDSRLIAKEDAESFMQKYPNYVPTLRSMDGSNALDAIASSDVVDMLKGEGYAGGEAGYNVSTGIRKAGDNKSLSILPLYEQAQARTYAFIKNQMRNDFSNAVAEQGQNIEDVSNIKALHHKDGRSTAGNEVVFYRDGKKYSMRISDSMRYGFDELYNKVTEQSNDVISKVGRGLMSFFKNAITEWNPVFLIRNFVRDGFDALIYTKDIKKFAFSVPAAFSEIVNNGELWQLYRAKGGMSNTRITKNNQYKKTNKLSQFNQLVEQLPRFVEFCATLKGTSMTDADIRQAMQNARDITVNFQRGGKWTKAANRTIVPFLNPSVQGLSKTVRTLSDVKQGNLKNTCIALGKLTGKLAMFGIVPSIFNELILGDDEEYKLIDERIKQSYYIFKVGDTKFFMLPKGRMMSVVGEIGRNGAKYINGDEVNWSDFISNAVNQQGVVNPFESNIFMPIARLAGNKTWYGGEIESKWEVDNRNFNDRYNDSTPEWAKQISNFAYNLLGDNAFTDAFLGPKKIENFVDSYAGVFGDAAIGLGRSTNAQNPFEEVGKRLANTFNSLVTDKFISDTGVKNNVASQYYDMQKQMQRQFGSSGAAIDKFTSDFFKNNSDDINEKNELYKKATQSGNSEAARKYKEQIDILMQDSMNNVEAYKAAAEKVLANYKDFDYGSASEREKTYIQMQIDNAYGGAEYALKELGESQYENAVEARDTSGIPLELSYKYYEHKQSLPSDVAENSKKTNDEMRSWIRSQPSMTTEQKNALASYYVKDSQTIVTSYNYDMSSDGNMVLSMLEPAQQQKYEIAASAFQGMRPQDYVYTKDVYNSGGSTKEEKIKALTDAGMKRSSAELFHKIQSGTKGYETSSAESQLKKSLGLSTNAAETLVNGYKAIIHSDSKQQENLRRQYLRSMVKRLKADYRSRHGEENILNTMYNILSSAY